MYTLVYAWWMTANQLEVLKALARYREEQGRMPSFRELARERGVGVWAIQKAVQALVREGAVRVSSGYRGFTIEPAGLDALRDELNEW